MWGFLSNIGSLFGIAGISLTNFVSDPVKVWLAFIAFILLIAFLAWRTYRVTQRFMDVQYPKGYVPLSTSVTWTSSDGKNVVYEALRHIQIKKHAMRSLPHHFTWTGSTTPRIESVLQTVAAPRKVEGSTTSSTTLTFPQTRLYNEVEVIHLKMHMDDSDEKADTYLSLRIESSIRLITFKVELLYAQPKYSCETARFTRKPIEKETVAIEEEIATVTFDTLTRSFSYKLPNPEPGYIYKLSWPRPPLPNGKKQKVAAKSWA